jgi:dihydroorotate dehydrogenase (fumarate)
MDLSTRYLGLSLKHPIVPSASPLGRTLGSIRRLEDAGAAAIVLPSLFEEQISQAGLRLDHYLSFGAESFAEALTYLPELGRYRVGPEDYLELILRAKEVVDVPIIGSLNGVSVGGWIEYARAIEQAGADALELNMYYLPTDPRLSGEAVEDMYLDVFREVRRHVSIPVAVKLSPFLSSIANIAMRMARAGADGLVLFNRFYQPDFDIEQLEVVPHIVLSKSEDLRLPLRWVAILYGRVPVDFAITSGVHTCDDALKGLMAGARVTMMASELLQRGVQRIGEIVEEISSWLEVHEYESIAQMQGSLSQQHAADPDGFERANYMKALQSWRPAPAFPGS